MTRSKKIFRQFKKFLFFGDHFSSYNLSFAKIFDVFVYFS